MLKRRQAESGDFASVLSKRQHLTNVCYGCLCEVNTRLHGTYQRFRNALTAEDYYSSNDLGFQLVLVEKSLVLQTSGGRQVGILNEKASKTLCEAKELAELDLHAFVKRAAVEELNISAGEKQKHLDFPTEINICGPRDNRFAVGDLLSNRGLFLQPPTFLDPTIAYVNPHEIEFRDEDSSYAAQFQQHALYYPTWDLADDSNIDSFLASLPQHEELETTHNHKLVTTRLYSHQLQAVAFMLRRESGQLLPSQALWQAQTPKNGIKFYRHLITGANSADARDELQGGLIADDMGLGKTLVVLTTIVHTLDIAKEFGHSVGITSPLRNATKYNTKTTLVVVSSALIIDDVWKSEVAQRIEPGTLKVHKYHGQNKEIDETALMDLDLVITTYDTVAYDFHRGRQFLYGANWFRIVLDEAHVVRTRSTKKFQAVVYLSAQHRWCLTGTPIQNKVEDVGSLMKFLRVPQFENHKTFRDYIVAPANSKEQGRFRNLRTLLGSLCLRRTRDLLPDVPEPQIEERETVFSLVEKMEEVRILQKFKADRERAVREGNLTEERGNTPKIILRLRIFCNTGTHVSIDGSNTSAPEFGPEELLSLLQQRGEATCVQCGLEILSIEAAAQSRSGRIFDCEHVLCSNCGSGSEQFKDEQAFMCRGKCPVCVEKELSEPKDEDVIMTGTELKVEPGVSDGDRPPAQASGHSSKLDMLLREVKMAPAGTKSIIFSFWKKTLDIVSLLFERQGISFCRIHGDMSIPARQRALEDFRTSNSIPILLMTIGCGAEGLNVPAANMIHIIEPQWNPAAEKQAIGRAVRLGQTSHVKVIRYIIKGSIEEKVKDRQQRKIQLAGGGFERGDLEYQEEALLAHMNEILPPSLLENHSG